MERGQPPGHLAGLALANAVAGLSISGKGGIAPTLAAVVRFLESEPRQN